MKKLTQRQRILNELIDLKEVGLNSYYATYDLRIKQAPTRIWELKKEGFVIETKSNKDGSVNWTLIAHPPKIVKTYIDKGNNTLKESKHYEQTKNF